MMGVTHTAFGVALTSIALGTANPLALGTAAIASQLPDVDTSKSVIGRLLFPISRFIEKRHPHRSVTHSFLATGVLTLCAYPIALFLKPLYWKALVLGYFFGWFADVFTKSGVAAFYPSSARLVIPGNPRLRLSTKSNTEWFVLFLLTAIAVTTIHINSAGGLIRQFNQTLGLPSGAVETVEEDASKYLLRAEIKGRNAVTQEPVKGSYEIVQPLTANDLLVRDEAGMTYRVGRSQECQIIASHIRVERVAPIVTSATNLVLDDEDIYAASALLPQTGRIYLSGVLTIFDADDLMLPSLPDRFNTITLQPGSDLAYAHLTAATPAEVAQKLGDYFATGNLIVRSIKSDLLKPLKLLVLYCCLQPLTTRKKKLV